MVSFAPLRLDQLTEIMQIERAAYPLPWSEQTMERILRDERQHIAQGIWINSELVGYGIWYLVLDQADLLNICIIPAQQGQGFGRQLLAHLLNLATKRQITHFFLEVRTSNMSAQQLYESCGFHLVGRRKNYYPTSPASQREDALIMALDLSFL